MNPMIISLLLVDDHTVFREGVRALLETTNGFHVVAEADNGNEALILAERLRPDVVVLDWVMPGLSGREVLQRLKKQQPEAHVIILSMHADEAYVSSAVQSGASGYILKEDIVGHLAQAVRAAAAGQRYFSPGLEGLVASLKTGESKGESIESH
jgi:two-component system response regulator NreC